MHRPHEGHSGSKCYVVAYHWPTVGFGSQCGAVQAGEVVADAFSVDNRRIGVGKEESLANLRGVADLEVAVARPPPADKQRLGCADPVVEQRAEISVVVQQVE